MAYTGAAGSNDGNWKGGGNTGLTTTNTWAGNTAYGPAGGMATGYATRDVNSLANAGMKPTAGYYSNFNNPNGTPMFGGALSGLGGYGMNAQQGFSGALRDYQSALNASFDRFGGQLSNAQPTGAPSTYPPIPLPPLTATLMPPKPTLRPELSGAFNPYTALKAYNSSYGPESWAMAGPFGLRNTANTIIGNNQRAGRGDLNRSFYDRYK